jgi:hypothetical protein
MDGTFRESLTFTVDLAVYKMATNEYSVASLRYGPDDTTGRL